MRRVLDILVTVGALTLLPDLATAGPILMLSPAVTAVDRIATFDSLISTAITIGFYTEDLLSVTTPINQSLSVPFTAFAPGDLRDTAFYYPSGGSLSFVDIRGTDGAVFTALDFLLGDGEAPATTNVRWQTFLHGSLTGAGFQSGVTKGTTAGWADIEGFDEVRVAASSGSATTGFSLDYLPGFGNFQSIAIDDVRAQISNGSPTLVPEAGSIVLVATGLLATVCRRKPRRALVALVFVLGLFAPVIVPVAAIASPIPAGRILVAGDENWTSVNDPSQFPTQTFATNIAEFLIPGGGGSFLYHIEDSLPWLKGAAFLAGLTGAGNTITTDSGDAGSFDHNLTDFDAVVVARKYSGPTTIPTAQLIAYVQAGGNVLVSLGSALNNDTGVNEAAAWNPFLNAFGLNILPAYDYFPLVPIVSSDPAMSGVTSMFYDGGSIITLTGTDPNARIVASAAGRGLFAVYEPAAVEVPEPTTLVLLGVGLATVARGRKRLPKN
jgi:hypothetical protein